jgi:hypothetical protein
MDCNEVRSLARILVYGSPDSRRLMAERLLRAGDTACWFLLADTVRSRDPWLMRARCLEALGLAAGSADQQTAELILGALLDEKARRRQVVRI